MARSKKQRHAAGKAADQPGSRRVLVTGLLFFLVEIIVIPGAYSPFRLPKMALAVGVLALLVAGWSAYRLWHGRLQLPAGPLVWALAALPVLQALSAIWAQSPGLALRQALVSAVWVSAALWLSSFDAEERHRVTIWVVWGAFASGVILLGQLIENNSVTGDGLSSGDRLGLTGLAGNPSDLAMAGLLLLPLLLPAVLAQPQKWHRWLLPGFLALTAVLTQALTGLVAIGLLGMGCVAILRSKRAWVVVIVLAAVTISAVFAGPLRSRIESEWAQLQDGNWYNLLSAREDGWTAAVTMVESSPVLGVGAGNYSREFFPARTIWLDHNQSVGRRGELATHFEWAHNDPLQLTAELGLLGAVWMIFFIVALARSGPLGEPIVILAALAWTPFLLLHYPTHLAIGLIPAILVLAFRLHPAPRQPVLPNTHLARRVVAVIVAAIAVAVCFSQIANVRLDRWHGQTEALFVAAETAQPAMRRQIVRKIEADAGEEILRSQHSASWLWRIIGRARLLGGAYPEAEAAFRRSSALEPHEEAEMGLGLALAGQKRTTEAIHHLTKACRVNPALITFIAQPDLRESVRNNIRRRPRKSQANR